MSNRSVKSGIMVKLNVYDLAPHNDYLHPVGLGMFHSGVEISGREYTFGSGSGVFSTQPRDAAGAQFRESIELGVFMGLSKDVDRAIDDLKASFHGSSYNLLTKNCNHFSNALVFKLLNKPIPGYVNRMANFGGMISCLLPPSITGQAPVDNQPSTNYGSSYNNSRIKDMPSTPLFAGSGVTLGSSSNTHDYAPVPTTLSDRRERVRQATLNRLDGKNA